MILKNENKGETVKLGIKDKQRFSSTKIQLRTVKLGFKFQTVVRRFKKELQYSPATIINVINGMRFIKLKIFPIEALQASFEFMQELGDYFLDAKDKETRHSYAGLITALLVPAPAPVIPTSSRNILPREGVQARDFIQLIHIISLEKLDYVMREVVFELLSVNTRKSFTSIYPERMNIGLNAFLAIAHHLEHKEETPPMPGSMFSYPSGINRRKQILWSNNSITDEIAENIGVGVYLLGVRKALERMLSHLQIGLGHIIKINPAYANKVHETFLLPVGPGLPKPRSLPDSDLYRAPIYRNPDLSEPRFIGTPIYREGGLSGYHDNERRVRCQAVLSNQISACKGAKSKQTHKQIKNKQTNRQHTMTCLCKQSLTVWDRDNPLEQEPTEISKQPIRTRYFRSRDWFSSNQEPIFPDSSVPTLGFVYTCPIIKIPVLAGRWPVAQLVTLTRSFPSRNPW
eukprot:sb/3464538/